MKYYVLPCLFFVILGVVCMGCINGSQNTPNQSNIVNVSLEVPQTLPETIVTTPVPTLSLGDHYLHDSYTFDTQNTVRTETVRIADPSWAIEYTILPLSDDIKDSRFSMTITNLDSGKNQSFSWTYLNETYQQYPMYTTGPYQIEMTGSLVRVNLDVAKRLP